MSNKIKFARSLNKVNIPAVLDYGEPGYIKDQEMIIGNGDGTGFTVNDWNNLINKPEFEEEIITIVAGESIPAFTPLAINSSSQGIIADKSTTALARVYGFSLEAGTVGQTIHVQVAGDITNPDWNFTPGMTYYLGDNGALVNTYLGFVSTDYVSPLGIAKSSHTLAVNIELGFSLGVLSVNGRSGSITLTATDVGLSIPVKTSAGGTNMTTIGTANQVLGVNAAATALEYKTIAVTGSLTLTNTAGVLTIGDSYSYTLPAATTTTLGGVIVGTNISVTAGTISVATATTAVLGVIKVGTNITVSAGTISVATATAAVLGVVKVGTNITVASGTISVATATAAVLGVVKVGAGLSITAGVVDHLTGDGNLHVPATSTTNNGKVLTAGATAGSLSWTTPTVAWANVTGLPSTFPPPIATATVLGGVKQGANVTIAADGTISVAAPYVLPVATPTILGGVKAGSGVSIATDGTLSVTDIDLPFNPQFDISTAQSAEILNYLTVNHVRGCRFDVVYYSSNLNNLRMESVVAVMGANDAVAWNATGTQNIGDTTGIQPVLTISSGVLTLGFAITEGEWLWSVVCYPVTLPGQTASYTALPL